MRGADRSDQHGMDTDRKCSFCQIPVHGMQGAFPMGQPIQKRNRKEPGISIESGASHRCIRDWHAFPGNLLIIKSTPLVLLQRLLECCEVLGIATPKERTMRNAIRFYGSPAIDRVYEEWETDARVTSKAFAPVT